MFRLSPRAAPIAPLVLAILGACTGEPTQPSAAPADPVWAQVPNWSIWSAATPLAEINTPTAVEGCPSVTRSGQTLYLASNRPGGFGALDLYVSTWDAAAKQWGTPVNLGPEINTAANEQCPLLLHNGKGLVFVSNRPGGVGGLDFWITRTHDEGGTPEWETPENLASLNSSADDFGPNSHEENGSTVIYFNSSRAGGAGGHDLYVSTESRDGTFSSPVPAAGVNTGFQEQFPTLGRNGLEIVFASDRPGTLGALDLWYATRDDTSDPWGTPVNLGPAVNSPAVEGRSSLSWDGTTLFFHSTRAGSADLYQTTRARTSAHASGWSFAPVDVPGANATIVQGINAAGHVVGWYVAPGGVTHGFVLKEGEFSDVDVPGAAGTHARGIGPAGDIVGSYWLPGGGGVAVHGFRMTAAGEFLPADYPGHLHTIPQRILPDGTILGCTHDHDTMGSMVGVSMSRDGNTAIDAHAPMTNGATPDRRLLVGLHTNMMTMRGEGFTIENGVFSSFTVPGSRMTAAWDVNPGGDIVGVFQDAAGRFHGFVGSDGEFSTIDHPGAAATRAFGINARGDIVGTYFAAGRSRGFVARTTGR